MESNLASSLRNDSKGKTTQVIEDILKGKYPVTSAVQARFLNQYDPMYDRPYIHYELNTGRYLNPELCRLLEDDRRRNTKHHLQTDKIEKAYLLALIAHEGIMRS